MKEGKEAAISIDRYLRGENLAAGRDAALHKVTNPPKENMQVLERTEIPMIINRGEGLVDNFSEVRGGFSGTDAANEVNRCMTCGSRSVFSYSDDCQLCRSCEENCPSKAITMKPLYKLERPLVKIADTWDEMAEYIGCDAKVLKETVAEWNDFCAHGKDKMFVKREDYLRPLMKPPFYALQSRVAFLTTIGGIKINEHFEVVDKNDKPIAGLYAGGIDCGGWEPDTYNVVLSGSTMGFNISSGRLAVHEAMKRIGKE
jgi:NAD-dependent dihydropyrimidine dehydrogenase PreA subunit